MEPGDQRKMMFYANRLRTFERWPYQEPECSCTAEKAGFFHVPSSNCPDGVQCFMCCKELDGWEPDDDPWKEHMKHSPHCPYAQAGRCDTEWTVEDALQMIHKWNILKWDSFSESIIEEFSSDANEKRQEICKLIS